MSNRDGAISAGWADIMARREERDRVGVSVDDPNNIGKLLRTFNGRDVAASSEASRRIVRLVETLARERELWLNECRRIMDQFEKSELHLSICNGAGMPNHKLGTLGIICNCPVGNEIKRLKERVQQAEATLSPEWTEFLGTMRRVRRLAQYPGYANQVNGYGGAHGEDLERLFAAWDAALGPERRDV